MRTVLPTSARPLVVAGLLATGLLVGELLLGVLAPGSLAPGWRTVDAQVVGNRYQSKEWGLRITAPAQWHLSQQTSYPDILLWMYRPNPPGKMLLSAEELDDRLTSRQYAERTARTLKALKDPEFQIGSPQLHAATGAYWIDFDDGKTYLRQALLVSGNVGYALTLSAASEKLRQQHVRAFDYALRRIRIDRKRNQGNDESNDGPPPKDDE